METTPIQINWANDFGINETLHYIAQNISAKYSMLFYNNQNHPQANEWNSKGIEWTRKDFAIKDMVLVSEQSADKLVEDWSIFFKEVESLEMEISKKKWLTEK